MVKAPQPKTPGQKVPEQKVPEQKVPFVGVSTYGVNDENRFEIPREYVDAVRRAGGVPLLLPPGESHRKRIMPLLLR